MSKNMQKNEETKARRMPTFVESITPIIAMMVILTVGRAIWAMQQSRFCFWWLRLLLLSLSAWALPGMR